MRTTLNIEDSLIDKASRLTGITEKTFLEKYRLMGNGLGLIDIHLMAAAFLSETPLWTLDKRLKRESVRLGIAY
jgi:hypothetical protein